MFSYVQYAPPLIFTYTVVNSPALQANRPSILSKKIPTDWIGREVTPGQLGLVNHGGLPKILTQAGRYPGMPLRNWWARKWCGTAGREPPAD